MIRSYEEATDDLLVNLHAITNLTKEIYAPGRDEIVTIGEQTQSYSISLSESLMTDVQGRWSKVVFTCALLLTRADLTLQCLVRGLRGGQGQRADTHRRKHEYSGLGTSHQGRTAGHCRCY